jgi:hypothetical protein
MPAAGCQLSYMPKAAKCKRKLMQYYVIQVLHHENAQTKEHQNESQAMNLGTRDFLLPEQQSRAMRTSRREMSSGSCIQEIRQSEYIVKACVVKE